MDQYFPDHFVTLTGRYIRIVVCFAALSVEAPVLHKAVRLRCLARLQAQYTGRQHPAHGPLAPPLFATYFEEDDGAEDARKEQNNKNDNGYSALEREICAATL